MTTVIARVGEIAADRQTTINDSKYDTCKLVGSQKKGFVAGFAGSDGSMFNKVQEASYTSGDVDEFISKLPKGDYTLAIVTIADAYIWTGDDQGLTRTTVAAVGSGADAARGALAANPGVSLERAVQIASEIDLWTGNEVDFVEL